MVRIGLLLLLCCTAAAGTASAAGSSLDWHLDSTAIASDCSSALTRLSARVAAIDNGSVRARSAVALEGAVSDARDALAPDLFLWNVTPDAATRDASRACRLRWRNAIADALADRRLYAAVQQSSTRGAYDAALVRVWQRRMVRGGAALDASRRDVYLSLAHELDGIQDRFWTNLANDRTTIRADRRTVAVDDGTVDFLRTERDADARKAYERAYNRRAAAANVPLLERAIAVRDRMAHVLGFESWADYRLAGSAIGDLSQAQAFLRDADAAYATARPPATVAPWDLERDAPRGTARPIDSVLDAASSALGIRFAHASVPVWEPGVRAYAVDDASSGRELGTLYVDIVQRPGKNPQEAVQTILYPRSTHEAAAAIVASWQSPGEGVIDGARVNTFAGDLGTAMTTLLAAVPYETLASPSGEARALDAAVVQRLTAATPSPRDVLRTITIAQIDLALYSSGSHVDSTRLWAAGASTFTQLYDPGTNPQTATPALLEGWDASYYARPWGQAYASDAASAGGERYRQSVFAPAASRSLSDELRDLLGREPKAVMP